MSSFITAYVLTLNCVCPYSIMHISLQLDEYVLIRLELFYVFYASFNNYIKKQAIYRDACFRCLFLGVI